MGLQGYCLILEDCRISLIGLGYIFLLACVLIWPPRRSKFEELDRGGKALDLRESQLPTLLQNRPAEPSNSSILLHSDELAVHGRHVAICSQAVVEGQIGVPVGLHMVAGQSYD
jgi:hypothetical protein